jgi:hypothetical protein
MPRPAAISIPTEYGMDVYKAATSAAIDTSTHESLEQRASNERGSSWLHAMHPCKNPVAAPNRRDTNGNHVHLRGVFPTRHAT